jgi:hypothetical protein
LQGSARTSQGSACTAGGAQSTLRGYARNHASPPECFMHVYSTIHYFHAQLLIIRNKK